MKYIINATLVFLLITDSANAIIIRHDINDKKYNELGEKYSLSVAYVGGCAATLIEHTWLLTAAHCVEGKEDSLFTAQHLDIKYRIEKIFVHPEFNRVNDVVYDIALVQLKDPVTTGKPAKLYSLEDEKRKPVVFVGRGTYGNGRDGLIRDDYVQRGATNTIISISDQVLGFKFDSPEKATDMEGISSRGDSGGPAFINLESQLYVAGVSSYQDRNGLKEGTYGVMEYYTRVSTNFDWLKYIIDNTKFPSIPAHPLIDAIKSNNQQQLIQAIDKEVLVNDSISNEAFYQSVTLNRIELAEKLILQGANVERVIINHSSLFEFALIYDRKAYFDMLLEKMRLAKNIHKKESAVLPLLISRFSDDQQLIRRVELVLNQGANINARTSSGDTSLILAGWKTNNLKLIHYLFERGVDLNLSNNNGDTPLMDAAYLGKIAILSYLLENGAETTLKNKRGKTALDLSRSKNNTEATQLLVSYAKRKNN